MADGTYIKSAYNDWFKVKQSVDAPRGGLVPLGPRSLYDTVPADTGHLSIELPTTPVTQPARLGAIVRTYFDDYYNQIHFSPLALDYGAITSDAERTVTIWSAFANSSVTLDSVTFDSDQGISIQGDVIPRVFDPLEVATYRVIASVKGPAMLDTTLSWEFDIPLTVEVIATGSRVRLFSFAPAWPPTGKPYQVEYQFSTAIAVSRSGREQRIANRQFPRKSVSYQAQVHAQTFRRFNDELWYWQHRTFCLPELTRKVVTIEPLVAGSDTVELADVPGWITEGAQVVLSNAGEMDIRVVDYVSDEYVTFTTRTTKDWPAGTYIYPALNGNLGDSIRTAKLTNNTATVEIKFDVQPLSEPYEEPSAPDVTFNEREVFLRKPNWANQVEGVFSHEVELLDYGRGPTYRFAPIAFGTKTRSATYLNRTAAEAEDIREMFFRMRGRQGEFYMPSWEYDFVPKVASGSGSQLLRIAGTEFATMYKDSTVHRAMFVLMENGDILLRKIQAIQVIDDQDGMDSLITVDEPWDRRIVADNIVMCGWLYACRFVSDNLVIEWLTDSVANVQLSVMTLEDLPVT